MLLLEQSTARFLRQRDIFDEYTLPQMTQSPRLEWDSDSDQEEPEATSEDLCQQSCQLNSNCLQYSFEESNSKCRTRETPRLGVAKAGFCSGWLRERMDSFREGMPSCSDEVSWPT